MKPTIAVLGGGMAGVAAQRELLKSGYHVVLFDLNDRYFGEKSSTYQSAHKIHLGFHYLKHTATAKECLGNALSFVTAFPGCLSGGADPSSPIRRGRYAVMSGSQCDEVQIDLVVNELREIYTAYCKEKKKEPFGPPDEFVKDITKSPKLYEDIETGDIDVENEDGTVTKQKVVRVFDTAESQVDLNALRDQIQSENIKFIRDKILTTHFSTRVERLEQVEVTEIENNVSVPKLKWKIIYTNLVTKTRTFMLVDGVVNCTWQNIDELNKNLNFPKLSDSVDWVRPKVFAKVKMPLIFESIPTTTFAVGAYCGFNNFGNGDGMMTYERVGSVFAYEAGTTPTASTVKDYDYLSTEKQQALQNELQAILKGDLSPSSPYGRQYIDRIKEGVARYYAGEYKEAILAMPDSDISIEVGFVINNLAPGQRIDVDSKDSPHHARLESGLQPSAFAFCNLRGMKVSFVQHYVQALVTHFHKHFMLHKYFFNGPGNGSYTLKQFKEFLPVLVFMVETAVDKTKIYESLCILGDPQTPKFVTTSLASELLQPKSPSHVTANSQIIRTAPPASASYVIQNSMPRSKSNHDFKQ